MTYTIQQILQNKKITDYLETKGIYPKGREINGKIKYLCPIHKTDTSPSFVVYTNGNYENYFCFGCLDENELVWTDDGLKLISSIAPGDVVLDHCGFKQRVLCTKTKTSNDNIGVTLGSFREPLYLTKNHKCLVIKKENAVQDFRRLCYSKSHNKYVFRPDLKDRPKYGVAKIVEVSAGDLGKEDYFVFPRISSGLRKNGYLSSPKVTKKYTKGPKVTRIASIVPDENVAWLLGMYLAEGSIGGNRVIRFTLKYTEKEYANRISQTIESHFGIKAKIYDYQHKNNTIEVLACSADLSAHLGHLFGRGACNKKIPADILWWTEPLQRNFIAGYQAGDGNKKNGTMVSCSKAVSTAIFGIAVQCGLHPCYRKPVKKRCDPNGTSHQPWYSVGIRNKDHINGFYETVDGVEYYVMPITGIEQCGISRRVVDISVAKSETFVTKMGATHNCKARYNIIHLYKALENVSTGDAIRALAGDLNLDVTADISHSISEIENDKSVEAEWTPPQLSLLIGRNLYTFLRRVDFAQEYRDSVAKVEQMVDKALDDCDLETLKSIYDNLNGTLKSAIKQYDAKKRVKV